MSGRGPDDRPTGGTSGGRGTAGEGSSELATELGRYAGHGLTIAVATALFAWLGGWLDERLHTDPLFVILGAFLGFGAGFYSMYRSLVPRPGGAEEADGNEGRGDESGPDVRP